MTEEWPVRPAAHLFYAQEKAEIEHMLAEESAKYPELELYLLRPPVVLGPHAVGAKEMLPGPLQAIGARILSLIASSPVPIPALAPDLPVQFIHEDDVGQAFMLCILGAGPPGAYNITGDGVMTGGEVARAFGLAPVPIPGGIVQKAARAVAGIPGVPGLPPAAEWVEAISHPAIMDASKAKSELGWTPKYTSAEALQDTLK
jgi:nucleoside-diphosphate-sugar epimerase